jgi:8-oxo-dGTP diphosphatase
VIEVACAVIVKDGKVLIAQRGPGRDEGYWEFPGGKKMSGETIFKAAERELREELGLSIRAKKVLKTTRLKTNNGIELLLVFVECYCNNFDIELKEHISAIHVSLEELKNYEFIKGDLEFVKWLISQ